MKIAIVSPYPPSQTTLNEYGYHLVKHFNDHSNVDEIVVLTDKLENGEKYLENNSGSKIRIEEAWEFNSFKNIFSIRKSLKKHQPDVVLYNIQFLSFGDKKIPATLGLLSPLISRLSGIPSVTLLHNIIETVDLKKAGITDNKLFKFFFKIIGTILTKIILQSNIVALTIPKYVDILIKKYNARNVIHMPHGTFEILEKPIFHETLQSPKSVMTFGKFGTYKKVEMLIEAIQIVRTRLGEKVPLVIAGTDNPNVKGYLQEVQSKYNNVEDLEFTGYVQEEEVPNIFKESSVVVFPYTSTTGSSGVLHQAGSYGKAAVLPLLGDLKELVEEEGYAGSYFDPYDVNSLAEAIFQVLKSDEIRVKLEKQNYLAASALSMSKITQDYVEIFNKLVFNNKQYNPSSQSPSIC
jgi:glycosyltransferase involved in cell wall biosynthesis